MIVAVVDTGVYVSALVFGGIPHVAVTQAMTPPYRLVVSVEIKAELVETLGNKFDWASEHEAEIGRRPRTEALWCKPANVKASRDPDDDRPGLRPCGRRAVSHHWRQGFADPASLRRRRHRQKPPQFLALYATATNQDDDEAS